MPVTAEILHYFILNSKLLYLNCRIIQDRRWFNIIFYFQFYKATVAFAAGWFIEFSLHILL